MAIKDNDGTVYTEIGRVLDNDGTTYYRHSKVYDNDGTSYSLIYTAGYSLVPNTEGALYDTTTEDYWYSSSDDPQWQSDGSLRIYLASGSNTTNKCLKPVNLTNYSKMIFTLATVPGTNGFYVGFAADNSKAYNGFSAQSASITAAGRYSVDISGLSGNHYFMVRGQYQAGLVFSEIYLEE